MRLLLRLVLLLVLIAVFTVGVLFTLQNDTAVPLDLLFVQLDAQWLALWMLLAFALGGVFGLLAGLLSLWRVKRERYTLKRQLQAANKELEKLRAGNAGKAVTAKA